MELKEIFLRLAEIGSPCGFEEPMIDHFRSKLEPVTDRVYSTPRGNVIGIQEGTDPGAPRVALAAHMDQVGFTVFNIDERGFVRFRKVGDVANRAIQGQQVRLITEAGPVYGVVGIKPGHVTRPEEANTLPPIEEMYIDVGAWTREEAEVMGVRVGTPIVFDARPLELANDLIASPGVDDKAGLAVLIATARAMKDAAIPSTVYYIGTVEEEEGLKGAGVVLFDLDVDMAVAVDSVPSGWQPDVNMRDVVYEVGKGPAIHIGEMSRTRAWIYHRRLRRWLVEAAEAEGIPYQSGYQLGGTDASAMAQTRSGLPAITVGVPRRYAHSPVELFDLKDMASLVDILVAALKRLGPEFNLLRT
ncbi:MAG: M42 family metallopeptidase [Candidatus Bathyarchaeota archaeon]|nr:MAG: M42 family metallopeptidase [Candidatus Bathyarchaeota archaeon]